MPTVIQPCGTFCVPALTPIYLQLGKQAAQPLIPHLNSETSFLEKCKTKLKTHFPECLYSLKQHLPFCTPHLLPLFNHSLSLHTSEWAVLNLVVGTCVYAVTRKCPHPELDESRNAGEQNCVLDLLHCKCQQIIHLKYKKLAFELLEQYILFSWFL